MPIPKTALIRLLAQALAARPEVLRLHSSEHIQAVVEGIDRRATVWTEVSCALQEEFADMATITIVADCAQHGCPMRGAVDARKKGAQAFNVGMPIADCPFEEGSLAAEHWHAGFLRQRP